MRRQGREKKRRKKLIKRQRRKTRTECAQEKAVKLINNNNNNKQQPSRHDQNDKMTEAMRIENSTKVTTEATATRTQENIKPGANRNFVPAESVATTHFKSRLPCVNDFVICVCCMEMDNKMNK